MMVSPLFMFVRDEVGNGVGKIVDDPNGPRRKGPANNCFARRAAIGIK